MMFFGTWIDTNGDYFDTTHFPTITISKMAKMPFKPNPRYTNSKTLQFKATEQLRGDISTIERAPYPQEHEINLPRFKMVQ